MKIKDIARTGLKGRKKDSLLIVLVIVLAFVFIVTSTTFQASTEKTKIEDALNLYGEWQAAFLDADKDVLESLKSEEDIDRIGLSQIIGQSDKAGRVGTFNKDLIDMARFKLYKGQLPKKDNEIMVELNQMSLMGLDLEVGQKVDLDIIVPRNLDIVESFIVRSEQLRAEGEDRGLLSSYSARKISGIESYLYYELLIVEHGYGKSETKEERYKKHQDNFAKRYDEFIEAISALEEEDFREVKSLLDDYKELLKEEEMKLELLEGKQGQISMAINSMPFIEEINFYEHNEYPNERRGDIDLGVSNSYHHYYLGSEGATPEDAREKGVLVNQKVVLKKEFIITGILESYSDKWDVGDLPVANAFITEEGGDILKDFLFNNSIENFSDHRIPYNIFLSSNKLKDNLYKDKEDKYKQIAKQGEDEAPKNHIMLPEMMMGESRETLEEYINSGEFQSDWEQMYSWDGRRSDDEGKDSSLEGIWGFGQEMEVNNSRFRKNSFAYPDGPASRESVLSFTIIGIVFIATALAILQIFLTQMKRRSRKIVLLKSIGASKGQIVGIMLYEGLYFLRWGLLIGIPLGLLSSFLLIFSMNKFGGRNLSFFIEPSLLGLGIAAGILALFVGMLVPMMFAIRIPLIGTMSKPPKHKKRKDKKDKEKVSYQSFFRINLEYLKLNKGKGLISFGLSFIIIMIVLSTGLLSYSAFNNYKKTVLENSRPDYAMEAIYGESTAELNRQKKTISEIEGVKSTEIYKVGKQLYFWHEGIEDNKLLNDFEELLPLDLRKNYFSKYNDQLKGSEDDPNWQSLGPHIEDAFLSKIYGIYPDGDLFKKYSKILTEGKIDPKKFEKGEEVILLVPSYREMDKKLGEKSLTKDQILKATNEDNRMSWLFENSGIYKQSYDERYKDYYSKDEQIKAGDTIYLSADKEDMGDGGAILGFNSKKVKVGGIIHYFPKGGAWPFSNSKANYVVISSIKGMNSVYPLASNGLKNLDLWIIERGLETFYPTRYGRTLWYIDTDSKADERILDSKLLAHAHNHNYTIYNYRESNSRLFQSGFNNALIIGLLGLTAASIAIVILYNILVSKMEQDKNRIGILQALGVTKEEFTRYNLLEGLIQGLLALFLSHLILFTSLLLTSKTDLSMNLIGRLKDIFVYDLWLYPWGLHIILSIVYLGLIVLINYLPSKKIVENSPVENIRSLSR